MSHPRFVVCSSPQRAFDVFLNWASLALIFCSPGPGRFFCRARFGAIRGRRVPSKSANLALRLFLGSCANAPVRSRIRRVANNSFANTLHNQRGKAERMRRMGLSGASDRTPRDCPRPTSSFLWCEKQRNPLGWRAGEVQSSEADCSSRAADFRLLLSDTQSFLPGVARRSI